MTIVEVERVARIYVLVDPLDGEVRYVGQTVMTLQRRLYAHLNRQRGDWPSAVWVRGLKARGTAPEIMLVEEVSVAESREAERWWIRELRESGCALTNVHDRDCCKRGHPFDGVSTSGQRICHACTARLQRDYKDRKRGYASRRANLLAHLDEAQIDAMIKTYLSGAKDQVQLAARYGIPQATVSRCVRLAMKNDPALVNVHEERRAARRTEVLQRASVGESGAAIARAMGISYTDAYRVIRGAR